MMVGKNQMKSRREKCHLTIDVNLPFTITISVTFERDFKLETHKSGLSKKAPNKIHALARITPFMNLLKKKSIMHVFVNVQFIYCLLV